MSKLYISFSLMLLISLKTNASENPWNSAATLSQTMRLENAYVSTTAELFKHSKASEFIDRHYCDQIVKDTQQEYKKKDGKTSAITTQEILTAVTAVKRNKKTVLNELTDSYSTIQKMSKRKLDRLEAELKKQNDINKFWEREFTTTYEYGIASAQLEKALKTDWKAAFAPIARAAAAKAEQKSAAPKSVGFIAWFLGSKSKK